MDKKKLVQQIQQHLAEELAALTRAAEASREAATHPDSKQEDAYDTRAIEAGYLAGAQSKRAGEVFRTLQMYRFLPLRDFGPEDVAVPSAVVELEHKGTRAYYFIVPSGGGMITELDGAPVQVITPNSPIGDAVLGHRVGDLIEVEMRGATREYKMTGIW